MAPEKDDSQQTQDPPAGDTLVIEGGLAKPEENGSTGDDASQRHTDPKTFSVEDIEKARREEKDKLYSSMEEMKKELAELRKQREAQEKKEAEAAKKAEEERQKAEAEAKKKKEEEMSFKELLAQKENEWQQQIETLKQERERDQEILAKERRYNELVSYRSRRLEEESDNIMPELRDLVALGNSEEEIEESLTAIKERTQRILQQVTQGQQQQRQQAKGTQTTAPPVGPLESQQEFQQLSNDDLKNMDIGTYAKNRDRLLGAVSQRVRDRGPYGG